jgi:hypothetical protein
MSKTEKTEAFFFVSLTICILSIVAAFTFFHYNKNYTKTHLLAKNIETAIEKGINPLSVRCSYAESNDTICITFTAQEAKTVLQSK